MAIIPEAGSLKEGGGGGGSLNGIRSFRNRFLQSSSKAQSRPSYINVPPGLGPSPSLPATQLPTPPGSSASSSAIHQETPYVEEGPPDPLMPLTSTNSLSYHPRSSPSPSPSRHTIPLQRIGSLDSHVGSTRLSPNHGTAGRNGPRVLKVGSMNELADLGIGTPVGPGRGLHATGSLSHRGGRTENGADEVGSVSEVASQLSGRTNSTRFETPQPGSCSPSLGSSLASWLCEFRLCRPYIDHFDVSLASPHVTNNFPLRHPNTFSGRLFFVVTFIGLGGTPARRLVCWRRQPREREGRLAGSDAADNNRFGSHNGRSRDTRILESHHAFHAFELSPSACGGSGNRRDGGRKRCIGRRSSRSGVYSLPASVHDRPGSVVLAVAAYIYASVAAGDIASLQPVTFGLDSLVISCTSRP